MEVQVQNIDGSIVIVVSGRLVGKSNKSNLNKAIAGLAPKEEFHHKKVVIDLRRVEEIDNAGFEALRYANSRCFKCFGSCCFCVNPSSGYLSQWSSEKLDKAQISYNLDEAKR